eukprot:Rmarinus@m.6061
MAKVPEAGKIQTVLRGVDPVEVNGQILHHEHVLVDFKYWQNKPDAEFHDYEIELDKLHRLRQEPYSHGPNQILSCEKTAVGEIKDFMKRGGCMIVDNTTIGVGRNLEGVVRIAKESGCHIVAGTGFYVGPSHPPSVAAATSQDLAELMYRDLSEGEDGVRCGVIGEIGCSWPLLTDERKMLLAAVQAMRWSGAPLIIHPGRHPKAPFEIVEIVEKAGADLSRVVISHIERTLFDHEDMIRLAGRGVILAFDLFGVESSHYQLDDIDMPNDGGRIRAIRALVDAGHLERVMLAHDIHTKHRLTKYGGHGLAHISEHVLPKMMRRGFTQDQIDTMMIHTPKRFLTLIEPVEPKC